MVASQKAEEKTLKIADMTFGTNIKCKLVLADAAVRKTNTNPPRPFLQATFTDGTDTITGMMWKWVPTDPTPELNLVYQIEANVGEYQGKKQLTLAAIDVDPAQDMSPFVARYDCDTVLLFGSIQQAIARMKNEGLQKLCSFIYNEYGNKIIEASSAANVHHVGRGGNLAHTYDVMQATIMLADHYKSLGIELDKDLAVAGAILHDIGKIFSYKITGPVIEYTDEGQLFDHIIIGIDILERADVAFGRKYHSQVELLKHIVASHHGQKEYGSPVTPKFIEAYIVNYADGISATVDTIWQANLKAERDKKDMTDRIWTHGNAPHFLQKTVAEKLKRC